MIFLLEFERKKTVEKSVVFVAELSYMEKLEVALKSLCAHKRAVENLCAK